MNRFRATVAADIRVQYRNGFYLAAALVAAGSILLLRWLPADAATLLLPVVILSNVLVNTFYFVGGLLLLERVEGTYQAQAVTPLRNAEYLGSKVATLSALSLVESLAVAAAVLGVDVRLLAVAAGVVLSSGLFCLAGVALVLRHQSISEFLMPSVVYSLALQLPVLGVLGIGAAAWYVPHPIHGPLSLMQGHWPDATPDLLLTVVYPLLWIAPFYLWSRHSLARIRSL